MYDATQKADGVPLACLMHYQVDLFLKFVLLNRVPLDFLIQAVHRVEGDDFLSPSSANGAQRLVCRAGKSLAR